jgi:hypothetical protein
MKLREEIAAAREARAEDVDESIAENIEYYAAQVKERARELGHAGMALEQRDPARCAIILEMRSRNVSFRRIKERTGVDAKTVLRLEQDHKETLDGWRKRAARQLAETADLARNALNEKLISILENDELMASTKVSEIAVAMGVSTDKSMALAGVPGVVIEHKKGASVDDAMKAIAEAKARVANRLKDSSVDAIEV